MSLPSDIYDPSLLACYTVSLLTDSCTVTYHLLLHTKQPVGALMKEAGTVVSRLMGNVVLDKSVRTHAIYETPRSSI